MKNPLKHIFWIVQMSLILLKTFGYMTASWWFVFMPLLFLICSIMFAMIGLIFVILSLNNNKNIYRYLSKDTKQIIDKLTNEKYKNN